jgi:MoaA/NifB/PqqE/SkfB family radical SAM enzyme
MAIGVPQALRRVAKRVLPESAITHLRSGVMRRFYVESVISKESGPARFARRTFTRRKPTLFHLDVHVTDHCNLNCRGCEHYSSISEPIFADLGQTTLELQRLAELFANIEQIYLLGGEPLLHPDVESFVREARRIFPATRLYVMTNGILVTRMPDSFWKTLHDQNTTLLCDSYPINIDHEKIEELGAAHGVAIEWMKPAEEFFKIPLDPEAGCDPDRSFDRCRGLSNCAIVRDGRLYPCAHAAYADIPAKKYGLPGILPGEKDSIGIFGDVSGDQIIDFLTTPVPWCAHCDFDSFETYSWARGRGEADEWLKTKKKASE